MAGNGLRGRILDAAAQVLAEGGPRPRLITSIAERAQVSRPTLYRHFPSRDDLYDSLIRREVARAVDEMVSRASQARSPRDEYIDVVVGLVLKARSHPALQAVLERHPEVMASHMPRVLPIVLEIALPRLGPVLEAGAAEGRWPRFDARVAITWTTRVILSLIAMPLAEEDDVGLATAVRELIEQATLVGAAQPAEPVG